MYELAVIFLLLLVNANKTVLTHKLSRWQCAQPIETEKFGNQQLIVHGAPWHNKSQEHTWKMPYQWKTYVSPYVYIFF